VAQDGWPLFGTALPAPSYEDFMTFSSLLVASEEAPQTVDLPAEDPRVDLLRLDGLDAVRMIDPVDADGAEGL